MERLRYGKHWPDSPNELWKADSIYLKDIGGRWYYLSTILTNPSRYIVARSVGTTMRAEDVNDMLGSALEASRL